MARKRIVGWHADMAKRIDTLVPVRGGYDEIVRWGWDRPQLVYASEVLAFYGDILEPARCTWDRKQRGESLNHDLYAYDPREQVAIIQTRVAFRRSAGHFLNVRKGYTLVGHNERTREPFRHPIGSHAVRAAVAKHGSDLAGIIRACQCWMWQVTPRQLERSTRQGDVLLVPVAGTPTGEQRGTRAVIAGSHVVEAAEVLLNGSLYARDLTIRHAKGQHADVTVNGWHRIQEAREAKAWDFSQREGD